MLLTALAYLAGIAVAAPPAGPLTMLFYRHAMVRDFAAAGAVAAVIAFVDGVYAALSTWGHGWLHAAPEPLLLGMRLAGVVLISGLGLRFLLRPPAFDGAEGSRGSAAPAAAQGLGIAMLNPTPLVSWVVIVDMLRTALAPTLELTGSERLTVPLAISAGVASWYGALLFAWRRLRPPSASLARRAVRVMGGVLLITAAVYAWQALTRPL